jgi:hypothetical protein
MLSFPQSVERESRNKDTGCPIKNPRLQTSRAGFGHDGQESVKGHFRDKKKLSKKY